MTLLQKTGSRNDATTAQVALAWLLQKKPFIVPIPGTHLIPNMQENLGAARVKLSAKDMNELESGFASLGVVGDRAPVNLKEAHDIETSLGTSSKGTHGKTPLPKKQSHYFLNHYIETYNNNTCTRLTSNANICTKEKITKLWNIV